MTTDRERTKERGEAPPAEDRLTLSPERAFVVQFRAGTQVDEGPFVGRVEHVRSGQAVRFESREELLAFIARLLARRGRSR